MHNLSKVDLINEKPALLNSGEFLMNLNNVEEIMTACKHYLATWTQDEVDNYNEELLIQRVKDINNQNIRSKERQKHKKTERETKRFIYLILNKRNGLYKIGVSTNPIKREKTLQSEEPEIEIITTFKGGFETEKEIHNLFATKRIRGEWFNLTIENVEKIINLGIHKNPKRIKALIH